MLKLALFLCTMSFIILPAYAIDGQSKLSAFMWKGKVISPECIDRMFPLEGDALKQVNLSECSASQGNFEGSITIEGNNVSSDYKEGGYLQYTVIDQVTEGTVVSLMINSGGTGRFSSVAVLEIKGDALVNKKVFSGGDRCNGGISDVVVKDDKIFISQNITPFDFIELAYKDNLKLEAYHDLESSAGSCFADVVSENEMPVKVVLNPDAVSNTENNRDAEWVSKYTYQKCFNDFFLKQIQIKKDMDMNEFKIFVDGFFRTCVKDN